MALSFETSIQATIGAISPPGVLIGHRVISAGDEKALLADEAPAFASSVVAVQRASGAARIVARELLARFGLPARSLPKGKGGAPVWPDGVVGSLSHDSRVAVAAVALRRAFVALGIDVEPAEPLSLDLLDLVATARERSAIGDDPYRGRLLFVAKEAVYKAVYPIDQQFLDHQDVEISIPERRAVLKNGRVLEIRFGISKHLLAVAFVRSGHDY